MLIEAKEAKKIAKEARELEQIDLDNIVQQWTNKINKVIKYHAGRGRTQTVYDTGETYIKNEVIESIIKILDDAGYRAKVCDDYDSVWFFLNWA